MYVHHYRSSCHFFFTDTATTEIYTLSLHDALPIYLDARRSSQRRPQHLVRARGRRVGPRRGRLLLRLRIGERQRGGIEPGRSEEHTSELQSQSNLVCRLLLEKKKNKIYTIILYSPS